MVPQRHIRPNLDSKPATDSINLIFCWPNPRLTTACSRRLTASARPSLRLPGAAEARR